MTSPMAGEIACPYCAETIKAAAKLCKHCRNAVGPEAAQAPSTKAEPAPKALGNPTSTAGHLAPTTRPCPHCHEHMDTQATRCMHCWSKVEGPPQRGTASATATALATDSLSPGGLPNSTTRIISRRIPLAIVICIALIIGAAAALRPSGKTIQIDTATSKETQNVGIPMYAFSDRKATDGTLTLSNVRLTDTTWRKSNPPKPGREPNVIISIYHVPRGTLNFKVLPETGEIEISESDFDAPFDIDGPIRPPLQVLKYTDQIPDISIRADRGALNTTTSDRLAAPADETGSARG